MNMKEEKKQEPGPQDMPPAAEQDAEAKAKGYWEQILRMKADLENTKKRLERDKTDAIRFANEKLLIELLPIVDNLDRALASFSEGHDAERVKQGLKLVQDQLHRVLETHGVQQVLSLGMPFNPDLHEAVGVEEASKDTQEGTVVDEIQRGYLLNGRLMRPSRVKIARPKNV